MSGLLYFWSFSGKIKGIKGLKKREIINKNKNKNFEIMFNLAASVVGLMASAQAISVQSY
jgi:hypothetical protein